MKVEELELVNFCQYRHRVFQFGDGLVAILGPNGSGKSNIFGAMRYAFTGEHPNAGTKELNICQLAPADERSFVRMRFSHGGTRATVQRTLRPDSAATTLQIDGRPKAITGDKKVNAEIAGILGPAYDVINDIVIVAQKAIFGFLELTPTKRAEAFQRMFRTEQADLVFKALSKQAGRIQVPVVGVPIDALQARVAETQQQLSLAAAQLRTSQPYDELQQLRDAAAATVQNFEMAQRFQEAITRDTEQLVATQSQLTNVQALASYTASDLATLEKAAAGNQAAADQSRAIIANMDNYLRVEESRRRIDQGQAASRLELQNLREPIRPAGYGDLGQLNKLRYDTAYVLTARQAFVRAFADGKPVCPTCNTPTSVLAGSLTAANQEITALTRQLHEIDNNILITQAHDRASQIWAETKNRLEGQLRQWKLQASSLATVTVDVTASRESLQTTIDMQAEYTFGIKEYQQLLGRHEQAISRLRGTESQLTQSLARSRQDLQVCQVVDTQAVELARQQQGYLTTLMTERRQLELSHAVASRTIQELELQIAQLRHVAHQSRAIRAYVDFNTAMRSLVHVNGIPKFVAQQNLRRLEGAVNETLGVFETDFRVSADQELSFMARFADGNYQPANRLSIGQQVVLALTFRLAVNFMFAENIGALYLDEPTAYVDRHHIRGFEPVLTRLREFSAARGLQCIIITHEQSLAPLFDSVVQL